MSIFSGMSHNAGQLSPVYAALKYGELSGPDLDLGHDCRGGGEAL